MAQILDDNALLGVDLLDAQGEHVRTLTRTAPLPSGPRKGVVTTVNDFMMHGFDPPEELLEDIAYTLRIYRMASGGYTGRYNCLILDLQAVTLLQALEPGRHKYWKIRNVVDEHHVKLAIEYCFVHSAQLPDAPPSLDLAKSELIWEPSIIIPGKKNPYPKNEHCKKIALKRDAIAGLHFWRGAGKHFVGDYFCSDEFKHEWQKMGLSGFDFTECIETSG